MDQFSFMVDLLQSSSSGLEHDETINANLALVESTLLHGYNIVDVRQYKTFTKRVTILMQ
jgi:hypothetical protein